MNRGLSRPETCAPSVADVLSVSPLEEDHSDLERIFDDAPWLIPVDGAVRMYRTRTLPSALSALQQREFAVIVCERDLGSCTWKDLLENTARLANPPLIVVTSRLADEHLWAEALNLGAHDVLAKPFYPSEVVRVVNLARLRWQRERRPAERATLPERAAAAG